jgi:hypothetical protein
VLEFERRWMAIPAEERLHLDVERAKTSLVIIEVRVSSLQTQYQRSPSGFASKAWAVGDQRFQAIPSSVASGARHS